MSDNWQPTPKGRDYALKVGMAQTTVGKQVHKFIGYKRANGVKHVDHDRAWTNWCDKWLEFNPQIKDDGKPLQSYQPIETDIDTRLAKLMDPFFDVGASLGWPKGFCRKDGEFFWPGKPKDKIVTCKEDLEG